MKADLGVIKPKHIDVSKQPWDTFGSSEREQTACWIVQFCQDRGHWGDFTYKQINKFYLANVKGGPNVPDFNLNGIADTYGDYGITYEKVEEHKTKKPAGHKKNPYRIGVKFASIYYGACPMEPLTKVSKKKKKKK